MAVKSSLDAKEGGAQGNLNSVAYQQACLTDGSHFIQLLRPATVGGGIIRLGPKELAEAQLQYDQVRDWKVGKFVPASGAATRMFKRIYAWIADPENHREAIDRFFDRVEEFAFFDAWMAAADQADVETFQSGLNSKVHWLQLLVTDEGLNFASMPKGLLPFHKYDEPRTPVFEHLREAMSYALNDGKASLHFTVSPEHEEGFKTEVQALIGQVPFSEIEWDVSYSHQDPSTDTVAIDQGGELLKSGADYVLRPGGHGALIHNLNALEYDLVFIKNIDNVVQGAAMDTTVQYKKALAGVLFELRADLMGLHRALAKGLLDENRVKELREKWKIRIPKDYQRLKAFLDRPIRVCGMVKNQGEPGGGPFWTMDPALGESLQIVEQAQVDRANHKQNGILTSSTHFNPVDLVCCLRNLDGKKIDLAKYIDHDQYFVSKKTLEGKPIKALEWPGLWNGAMAHWVTLFVEVPIETFNPVKELLDLLRPAHLGQ